MYLTSLNKAISVKFKNKMDRMNSEIIKKNKNAFVNYRRTASATKSKLLLPFIDQRAYNLHVRICVTVHRTHETSQRAACEVGTASRLTLIAIRSGSDNLSKDLNLLYRNTLRLPKC